MVKNNNTPLPVEEIIVEEQTFEELREQLRVLKNELKEKEEENEELNKLVWEGIKELGNEREEKKKLSEEKEEKGEEISNLKQELAKEKWKKEQVQQELVNLQTEYDRKVRNGEELTEILNTYRQIPAVKIVMSRDEVVNGFTENFWKKFEHLKKQHCGSISCLFLEFWDFNEEEKIELDFGKNFLGVNLIKLSSIKNGGSNSRPTFKITKYFRKGSKDEPETNVEFLDNGKASKGLIHGAFEHENIFWITNGLGWNQFKRYSAKESKPELVGKASEILGKEGGLDEKFLYKFTTDYFEI